MDAFIIALVVLSLVGLITLFRWIDADRGARSATLTRAEDEWSPDLPSHPYARG